ncbi:methionyl-tRNA formyltransferase [Rhizorhabdus argentea]|uniref:methionyl-tRNA formyltransferase n=1 Tax=Rhizorhabdus argentea TaxID=1387174 RepID=UPI0030EB7F51
MRIAFMGTPDFAIPTLDALVAAGHEIVAVYCQPPRRAGRKQAVLPSPVQARAEALGLAVRHPVSLRDAEAQVAFAALDLDIAVVAAYGLILPQAILDAPPLGCVNVHGSLLPRWRGAAPVQRAILAGDLVTGVTIMRMERGLDTGPMLAKIETPVDAKTGGELTDELARSGATLMVEVLADMTAYPPVAQPETGSTYAPKIDKSEARIDFREPAGQVERQIRAFNPVPGAWFEHQGERIRILACDIVDSNGLAAPGEVIDDQLTVECIAGAIRPTRVQRAGKAAMSTVEMLRGFAIPAGAHLATSSFE